MTDFKENKELYCRRLGHKVPFSYCAAEGITMPCRIIYQCWADRMSINEYLETKFTPEQLSKLHAPAQPKIASIVELISRARNTADPA
ncbi:MAG: hypothetical protein JW904_08670 [Spirochaetales bacterium]|nr:hypothetical protein [Spirochaetales bacterium]